MPVRASTVPVTAQVTDPVTDPVGQILALLRDGELSPRALRLQLGLSHRQTFRDNYLRPALDAGLIEMTIPDKPTSRNQKSRLTGKGRAVLRGPHMDTRRFYERASLFVDLVRSGRIEIRKTREPNHAKLYHFTFRPTLAQHLGHHHAWITGSSNLTRPGLAEQHELNVQIMDFGGDQTRTYFDALWDTAVQLTEDPETKERIIEVVDGDESILADVTPLERTPWSSETIRSIDSSSTKRQRSSASSRNRPTFTEPPNTAR